MQVGQATISLVPFEEGMIPQAHDLSRAVSWPHRLEDWRFFCALGQGIAAVDGDRLLGTALWWPYGPDFATLGMVIVAPSQQGAGIGGRLMRAALSQAGSRSIRLTATAAGLPLYEKLGFVQVGQVHQHQGSAVVPAAPAGDAELLPLAEEHWPVVAALDRQATGMDRAALLRALGGLARGVVLQRGTEVVGYSLIRQFGRGHVIGPVVAPDLDGAKALIAHWLGRFSGSFLRVDIPVDDGLGDWLAQSGLPRVDTGISMLRGVAPSGGRGAQLYGLVSQALG